jgi:hypothetical protein
MRRKANRNKIHKWIFPKKMHALTSTISEEAEAKKGAGYKEVNSRFGSQAQMNKKNGKRPRKGTNSHGKDIRVSYLN